MIFLADANGFSLYETVFLRKERYTSIETYKQIVSEEQKESLDYFYFPKYIPVGFKVVEKDELTYDSYLRFEKGNLFFFISQWKNLENRTTRIDTESSVLTEVEIDGHKGFYSEKEGRQSIYLNMGDISVNIYGNIGKKEIFKLAENLELLAR